MPFDGRMRIYPTLRCNLHCAHCVNRALPEFRAPDMRQELSPDEWIRILGRDGDRGVVATGGEPFLYPGLVYIANAVQESRQFLIYSNLVKMPVEFTSKLKRRVKIRASYHPRGMKLDKFIAQIRALAEDRRFSGSVHVINVPGDRMIEAARIGLKGLPWEVHVERDQRMQFAEMSAGRVARRVKCASKNILVGPDGRRYPCVSCLLSGKLPQENLAADALGPEIVDVECARWGHCAPCDGLTERVLTFLDENSHGRIQP